MEADFDTECYRNYWLLKFRPVGQPVITASLREGQVFSPDQISQISRLFKEYTVISFFGLGYDVAMITGALMGFTPEKLKILNDRLILDRLKPWELGLVEWKPADHIDISGVIPGAGGMKYKASIIHAKTIQDLPYPPDSILTPDQISIVDKYCENDLDLLRVLREYVAPQIEMRIDYSERYKIDLRSKSDAQIAEAVLKLRCEKALGRTLTKEPIDYNLAFRFDAPPFISYQLPQLTSALNIVKSAVFRIGADNKIGLPEELKSLQIPIGGSVYTMGIGGLHSCEKKVCHKADDQTILKDLDVKSYYPSLIINSGEWPKALGRVFLYEYIALRDERLEQKAIAQNHKKLKDLIYKDAATRDAVGKIILTGTFGKLLSAHSILFAPKMGIQTTISGQLSLLMLIEWHEHYGISVVSANTDGIVIKCPRDKEHVSKHLVAEWELRTHLEMEESLYSAIYTRDVNNYIAIYTNGDIKRKGEYGKADLIYKKAPGKEICTDAVIEYLTKGKPIESTIKGCRDITKFISMQQVKNGANKMRGDGPDPDAKVSDMRPVLLANGWVKDGRRWTHPKLLQHTPPEDPFLKLWSMLVTEGLPRSVNSGIAYNICFKPQRPEYLGKVIRWYYGTNSPGPIVNMVSGNIVPLSYGAQPCMTLPDEFPSDVDYDWYIRKSMQILLDIGL